MNLNINVNNQKKFANHITRLIENLEFEDSESNEKEEKQENDHENSNSNVESNSTFEDLPQDITSTNLINAET